MKQDDCKHDGRPYTICVCGLCLSEILRTRSLYESESKQYRKLYEGYSNRIEYLLEALESVEPYKGLDCHPEGYDGPCHCDECES